MVEKGKEIAICPLLYSISLHVDNVPHAWIMSEMVLVVYYCKSSVWFVLARQCVPAQNTISIVAK